MQHMSEENMNKNKKIPKYILNILEKRKKAANNFLFTTSKLNAWLEKENIPLSYVSETGCRLEDYANTGCVSLCEPQLGQEGFIKIVEDYFKNEIKGGGVDL